MSIGYDRTQMMHYPFITKMGAHNNRIEEPILI
jgi:hypothetical protein